MRDRFQIACIIFQRFGFHLRVEIIRQLSAEFGFDDQLCLAVGHAEKAMQHLVFGDRIAVARQRLRMRTAGDDLAVDQHAVAVENDEIEMHHYA